MMELIIIVSVRARIDEGHYHLRSEYCSFVISDCLAGYETTNENYFRGRSEGTSVLLQDPRLSFSDASIQVP